MLLPLVFLIPLQIILTKLNIEYEWDSKKIENILCKINKEKNMSPSPIGFSFGLCPCPFELSQIDVRMDVKPLLQLYYEIVSILGQEIFGTMFVVGSAVIIGGTIAPIKALTNKYIENMQNIINHREEELQRLRNDQEKELHRSTELLRLFQIFSLRLNRPEKS